jgi:Cu(I)/Ag(I) efflux system membrane fusion protein
MIYTKKSVFGTFGLVAVLCLAVCGKSHKQEGSEGSAPETENIVFLGKESQTIAGIRIETVKRRSLQERIATPGRVAFDERKRAHLAARMSGRLEHVYVFPGDKIVEGMRMASLFSEDGLTAQAELIQTMERLEFVEAQKDSVQRTAARAVFESSRRKLKAMGMTEQDIAEIQTMRVPKTLLDVRAPFSGAVIGSEAVTGRSVDAGSILFDVADLTVVWVMVDIYEKDLGSMVLGMEAAVEAPAYPKEIFKGRLTRLFDTLDETTRTVKGRVEMTNPGYRLKPGMYVTVTLSVPALQEILAVPSRSLLMEGDKRFVFVAANDTSFEKRVLDVGRQIGEWVVVGKGLEAGESIVTEGALIVKSEMAGSLPGEE